MVKAARRATDVVAGRKRPSRKGLPKGRKQRTHTKKTRSSATKTEKPIEKFRETAFHEAGHFVVWYRLMPTRMISHVTIVRDNDSYGHVQPLESFGGDGTKKDYEDMVVGYYAGYEAQVRYNPRCKSQARRGARSDDSQALDCLEEGGLRGRAAAAAAARLRKRSRAMVRRYWREILALGRELIRRRRLEFDEASLVVDAARGDTEAQEALVGFRPVRTPSNLRASQKRK